MSQLHRFWRTAPLLLLLLVPACDTQTVDPLRGRADLSVAGGLAPLYETADRIPDRYIIVLRESAGPAAAMAADVATALGGRIHYTYSSALNGFTATLSPDAVDELRRNPSVSYIVQDGRVSKSETVQEGATWGLDRSDQRDLPLSTTYAYTADGTGVTIYVLDTGIRPTHAEFGGRASIGADFIDDGQDGIDCDGHGTHVAGTAAGSTYGIAKNADVVAVRVLDCFGDGTFGGVTAGVDWVTNNHQQPAVANMSLGGPLNAALIEAVQNSIAAGVTYVVAAGNSNANACNYSPAATPEAITVAGTTAADERISFSNAWFGSNFGTCVDVFAPGLFIESAWHTTDDATETISGTSMSSPHVAGVAALYLENNPGATAAEVADAIAATATRGRIADVGVGSPNLLLFSLLTEEPPAALISLNPNSLTFTFVVDEQGAQLSGGVPRDSAEIPTFQSTGIGSFKLAAAAANPDDIRIATAVSASASAVVRLTNIGTAPLEWTAATDRSWIDVSPREGLIAPDGMTPLVATVTANTLGQGTHNGSIAITDPDAANSPGTLPVTANVLTGIRLELGAPLPGLSAPLNNERYFMIDVPEGQFDLTFRISGGTGDADMYVRYGDVPSRSPAAWDCRPFLGGNNEVCTVAVPRAGTYYVMLHAWSAYSGVTLEVSVAPTTPAAPSDLTGTATSSRVDLSWSDNSTSETSFSIQRSMKLQGNSWGPFVDVGVAPANATSYSDTSVERDKAYVYRVRACNAQGCSAWTTSGQIDTPKGGPRR